MPCADTQLQAWLQVKWVTSGKQTRINSRKRRRFGIALGLFAYLLPVGVVLPGVGSDIGQDGHLVNVGIVLGVDSFEFRMEGFVAGAGESGISFRHLEEGISFMEVGVVIISW